VKVLKIGLVDLDTSHPGSFIPIIRQMGSADVVAVWDGGTVYPSGYAEDFARKCGVRTVCRTLEEMVELVDAAFIHSCNWDVHLERAEPFVKAGKPVFIDKPICGNLKDCNRLIEWGKSGARIAGGSSCRVAYEIEEFRRRLPEMGEVLSIFASTSFDSFNYGIHAFEAFGGLLGPGAESATFLGGGGTDLYLIEYKEGQRVLLQLKCPSHHFFLVVTTEKEIVSIRLDAGKLYEALLAKVIPFFRGEAEYPVPVAWSVETIRTALACRQARLTGRKFYLKELRLDDPGFDGAAFARDYRASKTGAAR